MKKSTFTCDHRDYAFRQLAGSVAYTDGVTVLLCLEDVYALPDWATFTLNGVRYIDEGVIVDSAIISTMLATVVAHIQCNACDWSGATDSAVYCGSVGPLCPLCHSTTF